jgi:hypothetical protein
MDTVTHLVYLHVYRPILSLYIENRNYRPSELRTVRPTILDNIITIYITFLVLSIFSVPIGHAILHRVAKYDAPVLSSLEVGAVGGVIFSTAVGMVLLLALNSESDDSLPDIPRIVLETLEFSLLLAVACVASVIGAAILLRCHRLVLHVPEAAAVATLGCFVVQATVLGMNFAIKEMISRRRQMLIRTQGQ